RFFILFTLYVLLFEGSFSIVFAQVIPASQTVDWSVAGHVGAFPVPPTTLNVTAYGAVGNGIADDTPAIQAAINALGGNAGYVYLPQGIYRITTTLNLPSGCILRGDGDPLTKLRFDFANSGTNGIVMQGSPSGSFVSLSNNANKGDTNIELTDATGFAAGDWAELLQNNGTWDTNPATWADNSVGQIVKITATNGNTLNLHHALRIGYDTALNARIRKINPATETGIECMYIERVADPTTSASYNIFIDFAYNCWVRGVHSNKSIGSHVMISASSNIEVSGSYFHHGFTYTGSGTRGYGVTLIHHAGECLITNNIFKYLRHAMMVKQGANGNVFSYNYSRECNRSEFPTDGSGDIQLHGHYPFANLFEHNWVEFMWIDDYWGPSGPNNTQFRNRAVNYGLLNTSDITVEQNFVGLEITNSGFLKGMYTPGSGNFEYGNNVKGNPTPAGTDDLTDQSYYLSSQPNFWNIADQWPSIGYPNAIGTGTIPAKVRYDDANFTVCPPLPEVLRAEVHCWLQGPYNSLTQEMNIHLNTGALIPTLQPFSGSPWFYNGTETAAIIPPNAVDWVLVEVRDANNAFTILGQKAGFLRKDGVIIDPDGVEGVLFDNLYAGYSYYIAVKTRNHLAIISKMPVALPNTGLPLNLGNVNNVKGGSSQLLFLGGTKYGMLCGDLNADGTITVADYNIYNSQASLIGVYKPGDCNMDKNEPLPILT
ncbi:MAG TPA: glycosyl hydrolase family 28-related protein, partial [Chitinophagales bacterium]|nr:glycosyl hydrolase family 28-related protein [Chitinophagales bacterium]